MQQEPGNQLIMTTLILNLTVAIRLYLKQLNKVLLIQNKNYVSDKTQIFTIATTISINFLVFFLGAFDVIKTLLQHGADVNAENNDKSIPLHISSRNDNISEICINERYFV